MMTRMTRTLGDERKTAGSRAAVLFLAAGLLCVLSIFRRSQTATSNCYRACRRRVCDGGGTPFCLGIVGIRALC